MEPAARMLSIIPANVAQLHYVSKQGELKRITYILSYDSSAHIPQILWTLQWSALLLCKESFNYSR